jgi:hypothetical protein
VTVHGEATDLTAVMDAMAALLDRPPRRGTLPLEDHLRAAGLEPRAAGALPITLTFADEEALLRQLRAPAAMVAAARAVGVERVTAAIREAVPGLRLRHEWRYVIAANASPSVS